MIKNNPGISKLIEAIQFQRKESTITKTGSHQKDVAKIAEANKIDKKMLDTFRSKEGILECLINTLPALAGKDRAAVLMQIADLQRMKQEENRDEKEQVFYYHPVACYQCSLYAEFRKKNAEDAAGKVKDIA